MGENSPPILRSEFAALMSNLGGFTSPPRLAVAVSGGADSMALSLLAAEWAAVRDGTITGLTVNHGLRPEAAVEAEQVHRWFRAMGFHHVILTPSAERPPAQTGSIQSFARNLRYEALLSHCERDQIPDLLFAHHLEDQAETFLLRLERGSSFWGLAAMSAIRHSLGVRILRPLLTVPKASLRAYLNRIHQDWIEDPSNVMLQSRRVVMRQLVSELGKAGIPAADLAALAARFGRWRQRQEAGLTALLEDLLPVRSNFGYAVLDAKILDSADPDLALRALSRVMMTLGGRLYSPRLESLQRLLSIFRETGIARKSATLGGCLLRPVSDASRRWLICREAHAIKTCLPLVPAMAKVWDRRFVIRTNAEFTDNQLRIAALTERGWQKALSVEPQLKERYRVFARALWALPAIWQNGHLVAIPALHYWGDRKTQAHRMETSSKSVVNQISSQFLPLSPLVPEPFAVASAEKSTI